MTTDEKVEKLAARLEKVENAIEKWEAVFARFMDGPGKKLAAMFGVKLDAG